MEVLKKRKVNDLQSYPTSTIESASSEEPLGCSPVAVLSKDLTEVEFVQVYSAPILDAKTTSRIIRDLHDAFPLISYPHVKRVRKSSNKRDHGSGGGSGLEVILCLVTDLKTSSSPSLLDIFKDTPSLCHDLFGEPFVAMVSKMAPVTRQQFEKAAEHWPVVFHQNKQLSQVVSGELFTNTDKEKIAGHMMMAVQAARAGQQEGMVPMGAVIIDPENDKVLASCYDLRNLRINTLQHAVMVCVDLVAHSQGGGAWEVNGTTVWNTRMQPETYDSPQRYNTITNTSSGLPTATDDTSPLGDEELSLMTSQPFTQAVAVDLRSQTAQETDEHRHVDEDTVLQCSNQHRRLKESPGSEEPSDISPASEEPGDHDHGRLPKPQGPYLCTGYDLYVTQEPCIMCAMALVHSRIRRVFYGASHPDGALGSRYMIHDQHGLNHHFEVFKDVLQQECQSLTNCQS